MSIKRASKAEFKAMVKLWESKGHNHVVRVFNEASGMTLIVPIYGNENNSFFLLVDSVLPDPVVDTNVAFFTPAPKQGPRGWKDGLRCTHILSNEVRCKNHIGRDHTHLCAQHSRHCARHSLAENRLAPSSSRLPNQATGKVTL